MAEVEELIQLITNKARMAAMLAPSFPIVFNSPAIVSKLKRLGFSYVVEVAVGAKKTNQGVVAYLQKNPQARLITSPCASFVQAVRKKYPHIQKYLAPQIDSPMGATARIVREKYPGCRPVFIGPCLVKKMEAKQDYPNLDILVLTFKEINQVFDHYKIGEDEQDRQADFDLKEQETRLYPISGGLTESSKVKDLLADDRIEVISGWQKCLEALQRFEENKNLRLLDILFCDGGCINGPGIESSLNLADRRKRVVDFWEK